MKAMVLVQILSGGGRPGTAGIDTEAETGIPAGEGTGAEPEAGASAPPDGAETTGAQDAGGEPVADIPAEAETPDATEGEPASKAENEGGLVGWIAQPFTAAPAIAGHTVTNGMVLAGLGLILALLAVVLLSLRKKRNDGGKATAAVAGVQATEPTPVMDMAAAPQAVPQSIRAAYHQHIGARQDQQDSCIYSDPAAYPQAGMLAVVADGMGGLANGKAVSSAVVRVYDEGFRQADPKRNSADLLLELAVRANARINQMLRGQERSGSTLVAALIKNGYLHFLTVGDSRIYLCRGGALIQLNREHIFQEELAVKAVNQAVSLSQVRGDRQAHSLTSYFGIGRIPALDRNDEGIKLIDGDRILLASDGVFGTLTAAQLEEALGHDAGEAATRIGDMIRTADKPYQDNNTAVILEYHG